jgi:hypothetical protein
LARSKRFFQRPIRELTPEEEKVRIEERNTARHALATDAPIAVKDYRDAEQQVRDRTAKLRSERRAREAVK